MRPSWDVEFLNAFAATIEAGEDNNTHSMLADLDCKHEENQKTIKQVNY